MQTLKTCGLPDDYRRVTLKDLDDYLAKSDLLAGYNQLEQEQIRKNLGITNQDFSFVVVLNINSENPVQNKVITEALNKKIDTSALALVATSGSYKDLCDAPCALPNPNNLIITGSVSNTTTQNYDGSEPIAITIPTATSQLVNDSIGCIVMLDKKLTETDIATYVSTNITTVGLIIYNEINSIGKLYITRKPLETETVNMGISELTLSNKNLYVDKVLNNMYRYDGIVLIKLS